MKIRNGGAVIRKSNSQVPENKEVIRYLNEKIIKR
jgi:hypothetical protein